MMTLAILLSAALFPAQTPEKTEVKIPGSLVSIKMVKVPAGNISIGDKKVEIKPIWVAETEVTWDAYDIYAFRLDLTQQQQATGVDITVRPSKPYGAPDRGFGHQGFAALGMTDNAAQRFCEWLSKATGKKFRLATEAEWEYAARAGSKDLPSPLGDYAWYWDNADDVAHPVGKKKPNAWGIYDMLGNTWEWVTTLDGKAVVCGGSFMDKAPLITFSSKKSYDPKWQEADAHVPKSKWWLSDGPHIGMRVVCEP